MKRCSRDWGKGETSARLVGAGVEINPPHISATAWKLTSPLTLPLPVNGERGRKAPRAPLPAGGERQGEGPGDWLQASPRCAIPSGRRPRGFLPRAICRAPSGAARLARPFNPIRPLPCPTPAIPACATASSSSPAAGRGSARRWWRPSSRKGRASPSSTSPGASRPKGSSASPPARKSRCSSSAT